MTQTSGGSFSPNPFDFEVVCLSIDGGVTRRSGLIRFDEVGNQFVVSEADGVTPVTDGAVVVPCDPPATFNGIIGDAFQIAGPDRNVLPPFNGAPTGFNTSAIGGKLQSITVTAFATTPGLPGMTANQIIVALPGGNKVNLAPGETRTWSVERDQDDELTRDFDIAALGMAYATISWTVV